MTAVTARFPSKCPACEQWIETGTPIVPDPLDGAGKTWVHEKCPAGRLDIVREVCQGCWTEKSVTGACLCPEVA